MNEKKVIRLHGLRDTGDDAIGRLIAQAGPRLAAPSSVEAVVGQAAYTEWQRLVQGRRIRARRIWTAAAAVLALAAGIVWQLGGNRAPAPALVATVAQQFGEVRVAQADGVIRTMHGTDETQRLHVGDRLLTGPESGARVELASQAALRVDASTRIAWLAADAVRLESGAVYVDSGPRHARVAIDTPHGAVSHFGTRYSVTSSEETLIVRVRDGRVVVARGEQELVAIARQQLSVNRSGEVERVEIPSYGDSWRWADALATPIDIENLPLAEFLARVAHETGRDLVFASERAGVAARQTILHGSVAGLAPEASVDTVLATTDFVVRVADGQLLVSLPGAE